MPRDERHGGRGDDTWRRERTQSPSRNRTRSRSRSPRRRRDETRQRSPVGEAGQRREGRKSAEREHERGHHHRRHHRRRNSHGEAGRGRKEVAVSLPYDARTLSKSELGVFRPLLAYYLDLQKQKDIRDMDEREVRGRWKSFVGKWNRGELSSGWYDPEMFVSAVERAAEEGVSGPRGDEGDRGRVDERDEREDEGDDDDDDDDDLGPTLPPTARGGGQRSGPGIPSMADLSLHRETLAEDAKREREAQAEDLRQRRKEDRRTQRERLDDIAPRAEAGTRERMLEKRALVNDKMKEFREKGGDGGVPEIGEQELMGGGDSLAEFKAMKAREERKKTEREVRREEIARARAAEREERVREYREREEGVMKGLKELARQRFG
ncbi:hypothetical protein CCHL11_06316 [Colletotrichum chlorophyti]|uniref:RNA helicase-like protein n=1 Tax=Colletotrichum chlorophyti TaxID=708187 RepID=A0A1Q8RLH7_9PEZI|nr:hypothetical protein CCHL11_06316 [Colletotrichum chlorophyti]